MIKFNYLQYRLKSSSINRLKPEKKIAGRTCLKLHRDLAEQSFDSQRDWDVRLMDASCGAGQDI